MEHRLLLHGVQAVAPFNGEANVTANINVVATFDFDADPSTVNELTFELRDPQGTLIPATVTYDGPSRTATLNPNVNIADIADYYAARIVGGSSGVHELGGDPVEEDYEWYFITQTPVYSDKDVITGLNNPTAVDFASDGTVFVAEKSGIIKVFDDLNDSTPTIFADLRTNVHNYWDRGLLGMAVHPNYPATAEIYVLYTHDAPLSGTVSAPAWGSPGGTSDPGPATSGNPSSVSGRLSRLVTNAGGVWDGVEHVLVEDWGQQYPSHSIGSVVFGEDGALYASAGDGASFSFSDFGQNDDLLDDDPTLGDTRLHDPVDEGGALRSLDLRTSPEDPNVDPVSLDGTIIRIDPGTGDALPDNPLYDLYGANDDPNAERIIANGLRNPFRFTVRPGTNEVWVGDVGWGQWEEINVIREPTDPTINTFGWPAYEGPERSSYDSLDKPLIENYYNDVGNNASLHTEPFFAYRHSDPVLPGGPTGTSSTAGLAFAEGGNLNRAHENAFFFADYSRDRIWVMFEGVDGEPDPVSRGVVVPNALNPVQLTIGPGGDLFYVNLDNGEIRRVRFDGVEKPPTAVIESDVTSGPLPLTVNFDGTSSSDFNPGDVLTYAWDLDGDGQLDDSTDPQPSFTYTAAGVYTVMLEVTDSTGLKDTESTLISANNTPPTAVIDTPSGSLTWIVGDTITFSGHADDPDQPGGTLPASQLEWEIILHHCPGGCHTHTITTFEGTFADSFTAPDHEYPSHLEIELTATDPVTGFQGTDSVLLYPQTIDVTLDSSPSGLDLTFNAVTSAAPFTTTVIVGSNNSISAPSPQVIASTSYQFASWSDGSDQSHMVIAGSQNESKTASYDANSSDTTDAGTGTVTAQGENGTAEGMLKAFDNSSSTKWLDFANANPATRASWIQYQYAGGEKYVVDSYTITSANDASARDPMDWSLLGSDDGVNFTVLDTRSGEDFPSRFLKRTFSLSNSTGYNAYRLDITSVADPAAANSVQLAEIELIGVPDGTPPLPTVSISATLPNAAEGTPVVPGEFTVFRSGAPTGALSVNYTLAGSATAADYIETLTGSVIIPDGAASVVTPITPVDDALDEGAETLQLTLSANSNFVLAASNSAIVTIADDDSSASDTTDAGTGTVTAQGENGTAEGMLKAFDNSSSTKWLDFANANPATRASWIQYQYAGGEKYVVDSYTITSANDAPARDPMNWSLLGSDDGVNFTALDTHSGEDFPGRLLKRTFSFNNSTSYNIYRLDITSVADPAAANSVQLAEIELIGVPDGTPSLPTVSIQATLPNAAEGIPVVPGQFTINRSGATNGTLNVNYTVAGSATAADYVETLTGSVVIPDGAASVVIPITPVDDNLSEDSETLHVTLSANSNYLLAALNSAVVTIADDDSSTSDTTEAGTGTVTAQGENGTAEGMLKAFDNSSSTKWLDFASANPATRASWIQYQYAGGEKYVVDSYTITSANDAPARDPMNWSLLGSDDGLNFTVLDTRSGEDFPNRFLKRTFSFSNSTPYNIYRLDITSVADPASANSVQLAEIELFGVPAAPPPSSDTTDAGTGTVTAQGENGTAEGMLKAFDNSSSTKWLDFANANPATRASWIQYQYAGGEKYVVDSYTITSANDASARDPMNWSLLGSDDGVNFTALDTRSGEDFPGRLLKRTFSFNNSTSYNIYRLDITSVADPAAANSVQLAEIELIGILEASASAPLESSGSSTQATGSVLSREPRNAFSREDVNRDGRVSALDAVVVINRLESLSGSNLSTGIDTYSTDVNGDGESTAADALAVINYLARQAAGGLAEAQAPAEEFSFESPDDQLILLLAQDSARQLTVR